MRAFEDIPQWCEKRRQEFIGLKEDGEYFRFLYKSEMIYLDHMATPLDPRDTPPT